MTTLKQMPTMRCTTDWLQLRFRQAGERYEKNRKMKTIGGKISSDYGWEITVFHKIRDSADGVSFFEMKINWDRYPADHSPRFEFTSRWLKLTYITCITGMMNRGQQKNKIYQKKNSIGE